MKIDPRGVLLAEKVDVAWLKKLEPQFFIEDKTTIQLLDDVLQNWVAL